MTKLKGIELRNRKIMEAVIALCPRLKEIHFIDSSDTLIPGFRPLRRGNHLKTQTDDNFLSDEELESLLLSSFTGCWANVNTKQFVV